MPFSVELQSTGSARLSSARSGELTPQRGLERILRWRTVALLAGLFAVLMVCTAYRLLDNAPVFTLAVILFGLPLTWYLVGAVRKNQVQNSRTLKLVFDWCVGLTIGLLAILVANGALDHQPPQQVHGSILRSYESSGRRSHYYHLVVRSWRPNHQTENIEVGRITYQRANTRQEVTIELHPGFLGMPWYGRVIPN